MINDAATKEVINREIPQRLWYMTDSTGDRIGGGDYLKVERMSFLDIFLLIFPPDHFITIVNLTNIRLRIAGHQETTKGEVIKFFGVVILGTRFVFGNRRDLWSTSSVSPLLDPPNFDKRTGIARGGPVLGLVNNQRREEKE